ncbi:MAG: rRNA pseudouridine synthase [Prevotellaceae bacterium]|jgi:23S rRNA pseudouridine2605 synthase|nr:rRNA pseudouridine synthase [Prevotellaceae bacterium]
MAFKNNDRHSKPGRGTGAGNSGKSYSNFRSDNKFKKNFSDSEGGNYNRNRSEGSYQKRNSKDSNSEGGYQKRNNNDNKYNRNEDGFSKRRFDNNRRSTDNYRSGDDNREFRPRLVKKNDLPANEEKRYERKPIQRFDKNEQLKSYSETRFNDERKMRPRKDSEGYNPNAKYSQKKQLEYGKNNIDPTKPMRLNRFIANAGLCSRREADEYIQAGVVTVNGEIITELGHKIIPATDKVMFHDQPVRSERKVYLLLNKPKDCVTTTDDPKARLTVMDLVRNACTERIYPVGRLDRNTTGVLLLTNDGDLAVRLTHPKHNKKKIYHVSLDKPVTQEDMQKIATGIDLEDGSIAADEVHYVKDDDLKQVGIEIHSGRNRIVRRIFEHLGYKVIRLDRVFFAGLTKKNLTRGRWRFLTEREINMLRMGAYE